MSRDFQTSTDLGAAEPWNNILKQNVPGILPRNIPVFIAQGLADNIIRPGITVSYVRQLCTNGSHVNFRALPNVGHGFIARDVATEAVQWMSDRFSGTSARNTCIQQPQAVQGD